MYQQEDQTSSSEARLHHLSSGNAMHLLRRVHLVDPLQSPSWSGAQRTTPEHPNILHLIEASASDRPDAASPLQPGVINLSHDPNILAIRGLLLDTIKHVGPTFDQTPTNSSSSNPHPYKPPKWLTKLAITNNSTTLREVPLNIAANPSHGSLKSRTNPQAALQEKYDDFMSTLFTLINTHNNSQTSKLPPPTAKTLFTDIRMCVTEAGYFGIVPPSTRTGDHIFMVERDAGKSLFVVRRHPVHGFFLWNGLCYVHRLAEVVGNENATDRIMVG
jgi:hypothetical protein